MRRPLYGIHPVSPRQHLEDKTRDMRHVPESDHLDILKSYDTITGIGVVVWLALLALGVGCGVWLAVIVVQAMT